MNDDGTNTRTPEADPGTPYEQVPQARPLRFLMVGMPYWGHVNPTLGTVQALVHAGHSVTYVLDPRWRDAVTATGARFVPYDRYPEDPGPFTRTILAPRRAFTTAERIGGGYDAVLYEALFSYGKSLADRLGLPAVRLSSTFAYTRRILDRLAQTGGRHVTSMTRTGPLFRLLSWNVRRKGFIQTKDFVSEIVDNLPDLTYVYTTRSFQIDADDFPEERFRFIGPSMRAAAPGTPEDVDYGDTDGPVVYVSLGTVLNQSAGFFRTCLEALGDTDARVVMSIGSKIDLDTISPVPSNVRVYRSVPQIPVLQHTDLFITHGGMNSVNEALFHEVPMIVVPMGNDQPTVGARVAELGLGTVVAPNDLTVPVLRDRVAALLADQDVRARLADMRADMLAAGGNARAVREIVALVRRAAPKSGAERSDARPR